MRVSRCRCKLPAVDALRSVQWHQLRYPAASRKARFTVLRQQHQYPSKTCSHFNKPSTGGDSSEEASTQQRLPSTLERVNDATKFIVITAVTATVGIRHDAVSLWCVIGSVIAAALCKAIKVLVNQQRPAQARAADPGMPSSHATSLSFLATYAAAAVLLRPNAGPVQWTVSVAVMATGSFLAWLRVHTGYHTMPQTLAGCALGTAAAACWLKLYDASIADWCQQATWHFSVVAAFAAMAAIIFILRLVRKSTHT